MRSPCLEPHCPNLSEYRGRCPEHAKQRDRSINRQGKKVYNTKRWQMTRRRKLSLTPICEWEGCDHLATDVHHKHGVESDPWSLEGLEALCRRHHSMTTRHNQLDGVGEGRASRPFRS